MNNLIKSFIYINGTMKQKKNYTSLNEILKNKEEILKAKEQETLKKLQDQYAKESNNSSNNSNSKDLSLSNISNKSVSNSFTYKYVIYKEEKKNNPFELKRSKHIKSKEIAIALSEKEISPKEFNNDQNDKLQSTMQKQNTIKVKRSDTKRESFNEFPISKIEEEKKHKSFWAKYCPCITSKITPKN